MIDKTEAKEEQRKAAIKTAPTSGPVARQQRGPSDPDPEVVAAREAQAERARIEKAAARSSAEARIRASFEAWDSEMGAVLLAGILGHLHSAPQLHGQVAGYLDHLGLP